MITLVGVLGALLILIAFLANLAGYLPRTNVLYQTANAAGAIALAWYGVVTEGYVFVGLETVWALAAVYAIFRRFKGPLPLAEE